MKTITKADLDKTIADLRGQTKAEEDYFGGPVPRRNYSEDMNLAMMLLDDLPGAGLTRGRIVFQQWTAEFQFIYKGDGSMRVAHHELPSIAICLAWLLWKTGEEYECRS